MERNHERYASFEERDGEFVEVARFGYLECSKAELAKGRTVIDMEGPEEITWERYSELTT